VDYEQIPLNVKGYVATSGASIFFIFFLEFVMCAISVKRVRDRDILHPTLAPNVTLTAGGGEHTCL